MYSNIYNDLANKKNQINIKDEDEDEDEDRDE